MPQTTLLTYFAGSSARPTPPQIHLRHSADLRQLPPVVQRLRFNHPSPTAGDIYGQASKSLDDGDGAPSELEDTTETDLVGRRTVVHVPSTTISTIQQGHLPALKRLTSTLLPIRYPDTFFAVAVEDPRTASFSRVALYDSNPIGWIRSRLEPFPEPTSPPSNARPIYYQIYIQALCLLAPHRGKGVAAALLKEILDPTVLKDHNVQAIYAHVWEKNEDALAWYEKRGFRPLMLVENYYRKLRPGGAWIVRKPLAE